MSNSKWKRIEPETEIDKLLYKCATGKLRKSYGEFGDKKIVLPLAYKDVAVEIENFEVRDTDVWVTSYPKTGTTWTQEMVWMILNDLDYEGAKEFVDKRYTYLEIQSIVEYDEQFKEYPDSFKTVTQSVDIAKNDRRTPRLIKSHLPWCLLPRAFREGTTKAKMVHIIRNPKDSCVSLYHHGKLFGNFSGSFDDMCELFLAGKITYGHYWNILDFWEKRREPNILVIKYEDMKRDIIGEIKKVSEFLIGRQYSDEQISALAKHLSFENMKHNPYVNYESRIRDKRKYLNIDEETGGNFMRKGIVGSYKLEMSPEMQRRFDEWSKEHSKNTDISF